jgi:uncharacterized protein YdhG (YjbR/CyaY superfamily)
MKKGPLPSTVDAYIKNYPAATQQLLNQMRAAIKKAAPKAEEMISYGLAAYKYLGKPLVYFGGYANHIGFYATAGGHQVFKKELAKYKQGKGSVQFPVTEKLPLALVEKIVKLRVAENEAKAAAVIKKSEMVKK